MLTCLHMCMAAVLSVVSTVDLPMKLFAWIVKLMWNRSSGHDQRISVGGRVYTRDKSPCTCYMGLFAEERYLRDQKSRV